MLLLNVQVIQSKAGQRVVYAPAPISPAQSTNFAVKWLLGAARKRQDSGRRSSTARFGSGLETEPGSGSLADCLATEVLLAAQRKGAARARRDEVHKIAMDSRANLGR